MAKRQNASTGEIVDDGQATSAVATHRVTMRLRVQAPFKTYFDDNVYSVSAQNATGPFDILPNHHSFISILKAGQLNIVSANSGKQKIIISGGLIHVKADQTTVFLDI